MGELADHLYFAGREVEAHLHAHRVEVIDEGLESALPQCWKFETERESAFLLIDTVGHVSVSPDSALPPAVIVRWTQVPLLESLQGRGGRPPLQGPLPSISFTSEAGREAFRRLGITLGL